jgi:hypothetical protein
MEGGLNREGGLAISDGTRATTASWSGDVGS